MQFLCLCAVVFALTFQLSEGFAGGAIGGSSRFLKTRSSLYMGRAAAVRAATKGKTDAAKAKNNNRSAKKIIMAVKEGGGDPGA